MVGAFTDETPKSHMASMKLETDQTRRTGIERLHHGVGRYLGITVRHATLMRTARPEGQSVVCAFESAQVLPPTRSMHAAYIQCSIRGQCIYLFLARTAVDLCEDDSWKALE